MSKILEEIGYQSDVHKALVYNAFSEGLLKDGGRVQGKLLGITKIDNERGGYLYLVGIVKDSGLHTYITKSDNFVERAKNLLQYTNNVIIETVTRNSKTIITITADMEEIA